MNDTMLSQLSLIAALVLLGGGALFGIFRTKTQGFGRYSTSVVLLTLVLVIAATLLAVGKIEASFFINIAFAVAGFAGGLINGAHDKGGS